MKALVKKVTGRVISEVCYWLCEHLEEHTERRTTGTILNAGDAVAVSWMLDWKRTLDEDPDELPRQIANVLSVFSADDWREVMSAATSSESFIAGDLKRPEWAHLRRKPREPTTH